MRIYFAEANLSDDEFEYHLEGAFRYQGEYFWNYVEFGTNSAGVDEFVIHDGCGRLMPICVDKIDDLIEALNRVKEISDTIKQAEKYTELAESDTEESVRGW
jgi:hypothetical protein